MAAWTNITKPTESSIMVLDSNAGQPYGLLVAITSVFSATSSITSGWGNISKSTASTWTGVAKPTGSGWTNITKPT